MLENDVNEAKEWMRRENSVNVYLYKVTIKQGVIGYVVPSGDVCHKR